MERSIVQMRYLTGSVVLIALFWSGVPRFVHAQEPTMPRQLLDKLRKQNGGRDRFSDAWCRTLKEIVDLGPEAVPELIEELDATNNDMMLRCLGFTLRAIGDKRAVPALIRAIPKTLVPAGSDMGLRTNDVELAKFAQAHDLDPNNSPNEYDFGRPVRELFAALQSLTKQDFGEEELFHIFAAGLPSQQQRKEIFFHRIAQKWSDWWEQHWAEFVDDQKYAKVNLPKREDEDILVAPPADTHYATGGKSSGWILQSMHDPKAKQVLYDLDTGRVAALPEKWRNANNKPQLDEILFWATREGFDLIGTEYETKEGRKIFAIRSIGLSAWELPSDAWGMSSRDLTLENLKGRGRPADKLLLHYNDETEKYEPLERATFLFVTRHGTPGLLFVGIEVQDDSLKPGGFANGDNELDPVGFYKGRRFGFKDFHLGK